MTDESKHLEAGISRRKFVKRAGAGVGGLLLAPLAAESAWAGTVRELPAGSTGAPGAASP